jgi:hypothetical protein
MFSQTVRTATFKGLLVGETDPIRLAGHQQGHHKVQQDHPGEE